MTTIIKFISARIDQEQTMVDEFCDEFYSEHGYTEGNMMLRERVTRETESKMEMIRRCIKFAETEDDAYGCQCPGGRIASETYVNCVGVAVLWRLLAPVASVWKEHPDFRQEWAKVKV